MFETAGQYRQRYRPQKINSLSSHKDEFHLGYYPNHTRKIYKNPHSYDNTFLICERAKNDSSHQNRLSGLATR